MHGGPARPARELGGFDEHYGTHYQDVDLCLRLREAGLRNLFTPHAVVRHDEGVTRGSRYDHLDRALFLDRWGETIERGDPYYNPALSLAGDDYRRPHRVNVVFVNYHDFTSNSAVHIARLANELTAAGDECAVLVPGNPETITLLGEHRFQALDFRRARDRRAATFRTAGRLRSCTPGRRARPSAS